MIDAHGFLHRNYHALPKLSTSGGLEVGALYGFARWLSKLMQEKHPAYVAVCFDSKGGCARRKRLLPTYKANRKKPDEALLTQVWESGLVNTGRMVFFVLQKWSREAAAMAQFLNQNNIPVVAYIIADSMEEQSNTGRLTCTDIVTVAPDADLTEVL